MFFVAVCSLGLLWLFGSISDRFIRLRVISVIRVIRVIKVIRVRIVRVIRVIRVVRVIRIIWVGVIFAVVNYA